MDKEKAGQIINQGENEKTEFKLNFNKQVIETLVAFANTKGGKIFIGVSDEKIIKGVDKIRRNFIWFSCYVV